MHHARRRPPLLRRGGQPARAPRQQADARRGVHRPVHRRPAPAHAVHPGPRGDFSGGCLDPRTRQLHDDGPRRAHRTGPRRHRRRHRRRGARLPLQVAAQAGRDRLRRGRGPGRALRERDAADADGGAPPAERISACPGGPAAVPQVHQHAPAWLPRRLQPREYCGGAGPSVRPAQILRRREPRLCDKAAEWPEAQGRRRIQCHGGGVHGGGVHAEGRGRVPHQGSADGVPAGGAQRGDPGGEPAGPDRRGQARRLQGPLPGSGARQGAGRAQRGDPGGGVHAAGRGRGPHLGPEAGARCGHADRGPGARAHRWRRGAQQEAEDHRQAHQGRQVGGGQGDWGARTTTPRRHGVSHVRQGRQRSALEPQ
mmetsp:Transcript_8563/g.21586  ORF Transcript_8563/g.21586 Transcript_8563/m.21586 type:complete len:368 (-) Transcript_8563:634-1737(-)